MYSNKRQNPCRLNVCNVEIFNLELPSVDLFCSKPYYYTFLITILIFGQTYILEKLDVLNLCRFSVESYSIYFLVFLFHFLERICQNS